MKAATCLVLFSVAIAVSATSTENEAGYGSNREDNPGNGLQPGLQIGSPHDGSTSQSLSTNDRGSQSVGSVFGGAQALRDGQEDRYNVRSQKTTNENQGTNIRSSGIASQPLKDMFQNTGHNRAGEPATNTRLSGARPNKNSDLEDVGRAYRDDYRLRGPVQYGRQSSQGEGFGQLSLRRRDSQSGQQGERNERRYGPPSWKPEDSQNGGRREQNDRRYGRSSWRPEDSQNGGQGEQNGRRYGRPTWTPGDSQGMEVNKNGRRYQQQQWEDYLHRSEAGRTQYDRRLRPRYSRSSEEYDSRSREEYDSRSSEEYWPKRGSGRRYRRRTGDDSREDQSRSLEQRRLGATEIFEKKWLNKTRGFCTGHQAICAQGESP